MAKPTNAQFWHNPSAISDPTFSRDGAAIRMTADQEAGFLAQPGAVASERMLREVLDNLFAFVGVLDLQGRVVEANRAPLEAAGITRSDVIGQYFWDCPWWSWSKDVQERLRQTVARAAEGETLRYDASMGLPAGARITLDFQMAPLRGEDGTVVRLVASGTDITWRKNAERELQMALLRTELALEAGQTGVWEHDLVTGETMWDTRMRALFNTPANIPVTQDMVDAMIHAEDFLRVREASTAATNASGDGEYEVEFRLAGADHKANERWLMARGRCLFESGIATRMIGIARDITDRKQREGHIHMLMREIAHRSKNLLAVIQAMARQTATAGGTAKEFETRFTARLESLAGSQDLLVMQDWHGASLRDLTRSQLVHYSDLIGRRILIDGPDVMLKPEAAQNIGLALHELSTNAAKYGALSNVEGKVHLNWDVVQDHDEPLLCMLWRETGGPEVSPPAREGFGHKVLKRIAAHALEGKVTLDFAPDGLVWRLEIPTSYIVHGRKPGPDEVREELGNMSALGAGPLSGRV
ncbi:MAG: domain S-box protein [Hyphomicrobiales bacterium]|nr:domain S-box protein [Hyphomicrobiales bacterium]